MIDRIFGLEVRTSPLVQPIPKLQLSLQFNDCTDSFKAEMNKWLLDKFGTKDVFYVVDNKKLVLNHETLRKLEQSIQEFQCRF